VGASGDWSQHSAAPSLSGDFSLSNFPKYEYVWSGAMKHVKSLQLSVCESFAAILYLALVATASAQNTTGSELKGFVDLHTHPLSNLGFGGKLIYGGVDVGSLLPADPGCHKDVRAGSLEQALGNDNSTHGGYDLFHNQCGDDIRKVVIHQVQEANGANDPSDGSTGASDFGSWPKWNDITHQRMWVDWIRRAYDGGLRVMVALAVNNKTLGDATAGPGDFPTDDKWSADKQIGETKDFIGRHSDFMEAAYSSADVARIVGANKLAKEGVRYIFPVHVIDNPFGGTAAYEDLFNYSNYREAGHWWNLVCATPQDDITYYFQTPGNLGQSLAMFVKLGNIITAFRNPPTYPNCGKGIGQKNNAPLTAQGEFALTEMMRHGMLIDLDHMSELTINMALDVAEKEGYPVNSGHSSVRINGGSERNLTAQQYARIAKLHGMAGVASSSTDACNWIVMAWRVVQAMGNSVGIGFGTDTDGMAMGMPTSTSIDTPAAGNPALMMDSHQQHLFYRDTQNSIVHVIWDSSGLRAEKWAGPGSPHNAPAATGDPAVMMGNNQQHLFYRDAQGNIEHVVWDSGSNQLRAPEKWGEQAVGNPAVMMGNNQQHLFYRNPQGDIMHVVWDGGSNKLRSPEKWAGSGSPHNAPAAAGDPVVMMGNNQQHLFYRDAQGNIEHVVWDSGSNQLRAPEKWGAQAVGNPAVMMGNNQQHLFYRDKQGDIMHVVWDGGSDKLRSPEKWAGAGSPHNAPAAGGDPAVMMGNNQQHLFYRDIKYNIVHVLWDAGSNQLRSSEIWAGAGSPSNAPVAAGEAEVMMGNNQQHLFYLSPSGAIWHVLWDGGSRAERSESWAPARDVASAVLDGAGRVCSEYHPAIEYSASFKQSSLGTHTWNYNTDGVAHYGMIPDFLHAVRNMPPHGEIPAGAGLIDDHLMNGAEYLFQSWKLAEQQSAKVK
jgi:hypothetical protein